MTIIKRYDITIEEDIPEELEKQLVEKVKQRAQVDESFACDRFHIQLEAIYREMLGDPQEMSYNMIDWYIQPNYE